MAVDLLISSGPPIVWVALDIGVGDGTRGTGEVWKVSAFFSREATLDNYSTFIG